MRLYWYPRCSTCRTARKSLEAAGHTLELIDLSTDPPTAEELHTLWRASGLPLRSFFNTSGQSYRTGNFAALLPMLSESEQLAALAADGLLIKRPILVDGERVLVGGKVGG